MARFLHHLFFLVICGCCVVCADAVSVKADPNQPVKKPSVEEGDKKDAQDSSPLKKETLAERKKRIMRRYLHKKMKIEDSGELVPVESEKKDELEGRQIFSKEEREKRYTTTEEEATAHQPASRMRVKRKRNPNWLLEDVDEEEESESASSSWDTSFAKDQQQADDMGASYITGEANESAEHKTTPESATDPYSVEASSRSQRNRSKRGSTADQTLESLNNYSVERRSSGGGVLDQDISDNLDLGTWGSSPARGLTTDRMNKNALVSGSSSARGSGYNPAQKEDEYGIDEEQQTTAWGAHTPAWAEGRNTASQVPAWAQGRDSQQQSSSSPWGGGQNGVGGSSRGQNNWRQFNAPGNSFNEAVPQGMY